MDDEDQVVSMESDFYSTQFSDSTEAWEYAMRRERQEILPGIYLGPYSSATKSKRNELFNDGITHIICVRDESESKFIKPNFGNEIQYLVLSIADNCFQNIIPFFPRVRDFINDCLSKGGKVLIHGNAGISRSASLLISYIMDMSKVSYSNALNMVQNKRYCVHPNPNFQRQLVEYEPILRAQNVVLRAYIQKRSYEYVEDMMNG